MKKSLALLLVMAMLLALVPAYAETASATKEAPMLAELVAKGELPPLEERLPAEPKVFDAVTDEYLDIKIGKYGGTMRQASTAVGGSNTINRMLGEPLLTYPDMEGSVITGNVLKGYELSEDGKVYTFYMREGMKWSDGMPLTTADVAFTFNDLYMNKEYTSSLPAWLCAGGSVGGAPAQLEVVDDYTFKLIYEEPYYGLPMQLAIKNWVSYYDMINPAHYLKKYHPAYADAAELEAMIEEKGYDNWVALFDYYRITSGEEGHAVAYGYPVLNAWMAYEYSDSVWTYQRNPYYYMTDYEGNQLPYIDYIRCEYVQDAQVKQMMMASGEIDYEGFDGSLSNMALYMENAEEKGYKVVMTNWHTTNNDFYFSMAHDPSAKITEILNNHDFRAGINHAIDKQDIIDSVFLGFAEPSTITPDVYDVDKANELLDKVLPMGADGWRTYPDGTEFSMQLLTAQLTLEQMPTCELIASMLADVGVRCDVKGYDVGLAAQMAYSNEHESLVMWTEVLWFNVGEWMISMYGNLWWSWWTSGGAAGVEPPENVKELFAMHTEMHNSKTLEESLALFEEIKDFYGEELYILRIAEAVQQPMIANAKLGNVDYKKLPWGFNVIFSGKIFYFED